MAIYQNNTRTPILLNAYGVVIDSSLIMCYDAGNPYSLTDTRTSASGITTTVTDLSQAGNNGLNYHFLNDFYTGSNGGVFDALQGYLYSNSPNLTSSFNRDPLTVSAWFYQSTAYDNGSTLANTNYVISNTDGAGVDRGVILGTGRQLSVAAGSTALIATGVYITPNEWYNVTVTYSTTNVKLYINSVLRWSKGSAAVASTGSLVNFGNNYTLFLGGTTTNLAGYVGLPMVYNRELSQAEITQNYTSQAARFGLTAALPPLKLYFDPGNTASYDPNGSTPTKIYDLSGNKYTGSLSASNATTAVPPVYNTAGGGSLFFNGQASGTAGTSGSYIGGFRSGSSAPGDINIGNVNTVDMWINLSAQVGIWLTKQAVTDYYYIISGGNTRIDVGGSLSIDFATALATGTWYNLVIVRNGDAAWCYLNGYQVSPSYDTGNGTLDFTLFKIGGYLTNSGFYPRGYLGEFKIYNGVLSAIQVYNNFQSSRARYGV